jgi:hypothetical protein
MGVGHCVQFVVLIFVLFSFFFLFESDLLFVSGEFDSAIRLPFFLLFLPLQHAYFIEYVSLFLSSPHVKQTQNKTNTPVQQTHAQSSSFLENEAPKKYCPGQTHTLLQMISVQHIQ